MVASGLEKVKAIEQQFIRTDLPVVNVGDFVKMRVKVKEAEKIRIHPFEGTVIKITGRGSKGTFTVRKISFGEGVERTSVFFRSTRRLSKACRSSARVSPSVPVFIIFATE